MKNIIGGIWGLFLCILISLFTESCKTKKIAAVEIGKRTFDSAQTVKEQASVKYSLVDTSRIDEYTTLIREYIFDTPYYDNESCFAHDTNVNSPMVEYKGDGSVIIHHGLKSIKETKISRKSEKKGMSEQKDSIGNKQSNTKVSTTEHKKQKHKQVEQVQISEPFQWWQLIIGASVLFAVACLLLYLKRNKPKIKDIISNICNRIKQKLM